MGGITAYIRLANEENTILSCLESIRGVFDQILVIHSEVTDSSLELVKRYARENSAADIVVKEYPHLVLPPHSVEYDGGGFNYENSLAAYYNFGLDSVRTEFVMKIDADQIYFNEELSKLVRSSICSDEENIRAVKGHNCIVSNGGLHLFKSSPFNGGNDHFLMRVRDAFFEQSRYWEVLCPKKDIPFICDGRTYWIHMKKGHRHKGKFVSGDNYRPDSLVAMDDLLVENYERHVLPLLESTGSKYKDLKYK